MFTFVGQNETVRRRGALVIAISLGLHLAALSALLGAQLWSVPPIREPQVNSVLVLLGQLPVPPGGGQTAVRKEVKKDTSAKQPPIPRTSIHQPDPEAVTPKLPADPPPQSTSDSVDPNADPLAPPGPGLPPGDGPGPPGLPGGPPGPAGPIDDAPITINGSVVKPQLIPESKVQPRYTEMARKARLQGMVVLEAIIDERGNVVNVRELRGLPMGLTDEAIAAVSQWKFRPATLAGRPVKVYFSLRVDFLVH